MFSSSLFHALLQFPPAWVPQCQLHMLSLGASSALLVSRSATQGCVLYRMSRADDYLEALLHAVSAFYTRCGHTSHVRHSLCPCYIDAAGVRTSLTRLAWRAVSCIRVLYRC